MPVANEGEVENVHFGLNLSPPCELRSLAAPLVPPFPPNGPSTSCLLRVTNSEASKTSESKDSHTKVKEQRMVLTV